MVQEGVTQWCGVLLRWSGSIFRYRGASALWEGWQPIKMEENQLNWVTYGDSVSLSLSLSLSPYSPNYGKPCKKQFCYKGMVSGRDKVSVCVFFPHAFGYRDARTNRARCDVSDQMCLLWHSSLSHWSGQGWHVLYIHLWWSEEFGTIKLNLEKIFTSTFFDVFLCFFVFL